MSISGEDGPTALAPRSNNRQVALDSLRAVEGAGFRIILGVATFFGLGVLLPVGLAFFVPDSAHAGFWGYFVVIQILLSLRIAVLIISGSGRLFEFIFSAFCYVFFGLAPAVQFRTGDLPTTTPHVQLADIPVAIIVVSVGIACAYVGFIAARLSGEQASPVGVRGVSFAHGLTLLFVGGTLAAIYLVLLGPTSFLEARADFNVIRDERFSDATTAATVEALATVPLLVGAHAILSRRQAATRSKWRPLGWLGMCLALYLTNPISSARYTSGTVWGSLVGPTGLLRTPTRRSVSMVLIIIGFLFVFPILDLFRFAGGPKTVRSGFFAEYAGNGDYDAFAQIVNSVEYVGSPAWVPFRQSLGPVFFWVPRSLWDAKPLDSGVLLGQFKGYAFTNLSAPLWAEFLMALGFGGVVIGFLITGFALGRADSLLATGQGSFGVLVSSILPFYLIILLRGSLLQATGTAVILVLCLFFVRDKRAARTESLRG